MAEISEVRQLFYNALKTFADAQTPALRIYIRGQEFTPANDETWLRFTLLTARPSKVFAGTGYHSRESGIFQVDIFGPEGRGEKAFEMIAWDIREHFWPNTVTAPTLGTNPLVRLGPEAPHVRPAPESGKGLLGAIVSIPFYSHFSRA